MAWLMLKRKHRCVAVSRGFEGVGPIRRWLTDLVLMTLVITAIAGAYTTGDAGAALLQVLVIVGLYGVFLSGWSVLGLSIEIWRARHLLRLLEANELGAVLDRLRGRRWLLLGAVRGLYQQWASGVLAPDRAPLLDALEMRLSETNGRVRDLGDVLLTIGLVGTILGLMMMMTSLTGVMGTTVELGGASLVQGMFGAGGPMVGLGTAFETTLAGSVFGGLILRVLSASTARSIDRFVVHSDELIVRRVLPALSRTHSNDKRAEREAA